MIRISLHLHAASSARGCKLASSMTTGAAWIWPVNLLIQSGVKKASCSYIGLGTQRKSKRTMKTLKREIICYEIWSPNIRLWNSIDVSTASMFYVIPTQRDGKAKVWRYIQKALKQLTTASVSATAAATSPPPSNTAETTGVETPTHFRTPGEHLYAASGINRLASYQQ